MSLQHRNRDESCPRQPRWSARMETRHRSRLRHVRKELRDRTSRSLLVSDTHPVSLGQKVQVRAGRCFPTPCFERRGRSSTTLSMFRLAESKVQSCWHPTTPLVSLRESPCGFPNGANPAKKKSTCGLRASLPDDGSVP